MAYFTQENHHALSSSAYNIDGDANLQTAYNKFMDLHRALYPRLRDHKWDLHPHWNKNEIISDSSTAGKSGPSTLTLSYLRSREHATIVERSMGKDSAGTTANASIQRHPVIELRLTPEYFTIELVVSPYALWDQRNLVGKLDVERHRASFNNMIYRMDEDFRFGFWSGTHLGDMHIMTRQLVARHVFDQWMQTFEEGHDWLRVGVWYPAEDIAIDSAHIIHETLNRMSALYNLYDFILWTSGNNYHNFYNKRQEQLRKFYQRAAVQAG